MTESPCLSHFGCDQLLNGELPHEASARAHLATCPKCTVRLAQHVDERAAFAVPLRRPRRAWVGLGAVAAAGVLAGVWLVMPPPVAATRAKGHASIGFFVQHDGVTRHGGAGEIVAAGDALDFTVSTDRAAYLAVVSVDAARAVNVYYPAGPTAAPLEAGRDQVLPLGVILDGVLGSERIHGVFCDRPFTVDEAKAFVTDGVPLPADCAVDVTTIEKR